MNDPSYDIEYGPIRHLRMPKGGFKRKRITRVEFVRALRRNDLAIVVPSPAVRIETYGEGRRCLCGALLSRYNPGNFCAACHCEGWTDE